MNYEHNNKKEKEPVIRASLFHRAINPLIRLQIGGGLGPFSLSGPSGLLLKSGF